MGRAARAGSRLARVGGGSSLPGLLAEGIAPGVVAEIVGRSHCRAVVVTGSNGKTTACRLITQALLKEGLRVAGNASGANMPAGVASAVIGASSLSGRLSADLLVLEVDEASMRCVVPEVAPAAVVVTNCFKDQLDRYGEVDTTLSLIRQATDKLSARSVLILNADDPLVADLARTARCKSLFFSVEPQKQKIASTPSGPCTGGDPAAAGARDAVNCLVCGAHYDYEYTILGHLGRYTCPKCGASHPRAHFVARDLAERPGSLWSFTLEAPDSFGGQPGGARIALDVSLAIPGLYNVYNALAAGACALALGASERAVAEGIKGTHSAFGRMEQMMIGQVRVRLILVKNPVGLSEVAKSVALDESIGAILMCLNDRYADGRDVSWIWDADLRALVSRFPRIRTLVCSGTRAWDMALRLKYAGVAQERIACEPSIGRALERTLASVKPGETLAILPTYTAMLDVRERMRRRAHLPEFWRS
ncbi:MAG: MurT ligase domain-containing protein [Clostridia bacterium]|nr:MurT ligase domain-containing protein [Clostridia bacterium]